jgi:glycerol-3-phosphate cytidylyltransferase-like family protein
VTALSRTRKEKRKEMMKDEKNRLRFVQKFCDHRELLQQIVLHQSFDDRFEFFARMRHDVIIVDVDVFKQLNSIIHKRAEHYDMFNRLIVSIASTEDRLHVENLTTMKKIRKIDLLDANLNR